MEYLLFLQNLREGASEFFNTLMYLISDYAGGAFGIIIPALIYWCLDKRAGTFMTMSFSSAYFVNQSIKNICCVYRPSVLYSEIRPYKKAVAGATGYSFPSGHTTNASTVFGGVAVWQRKRRKVLSIFCLLFVAFIAFSRNYLGVHTIWDVLAAAASSFIVMYLCSLLLKFIERNPEKDILVTIIAVVLGVIAIIVFEFKPYPEDVNAAGELLADPYEMKTDCYRSFGLFIGFFVGWLIERRFIRFTTECGAKVKVLRFIVGVAVSLLFYGVLLPIIFEPLGEHIGKLFKYFFTALIVVAGYPALFNFAERKLSSGNKFAEKGEKDKSESADK